MASGSVHSGTGGLGNASVTLQQQKTYSRVYMPLIVELVHAVPPAREQSRLSTEQYKRLRHYWKTSILEQQPSYSGIDWNNLVEQAIAYLRQHPDDWQQLLTTHAEELDRLHIGDQSLYGGHLTGPTQQALAQKVLDTVLSGPMLQYDVFEHFYNASRHAVVVPSQVLAARTVPRRDADEESDSKRPRLTQTSAPVTEQFAHLRISSPAHALSSMSQATGGAAASHTHSPILQHSSAPSMMDEEDLLDMQRELSLQHGSRVAGSPIIFNLLRRRRASSVSESDVEPVLHSATRLSLSELLHPPVPSGRISAISTASTQLPSGRSSALSGATAHSRASSVMSMYDSAGSLLVEEMKGDMKGDTKVFAQSETASLPTPSARISSPSTTHRPLAVMATPTTAAGITMDLAGSLPPSSQRLQSSLCFTHIPVRGCVTPYMVQRMSVPEVVERQVRRHTGIGSIVVLHRHPITNTPYVLQCTCGSVPCAYDVRCDCDNEDCVWPDWVHKGGMAVADIRPSIQQNPF